MSAPVPPVIAAVIGARSSGKTSVVEQVAAALAAAGWRLGGVTQPGVGAPPLRTGYRLRDVASGQERAFARRDEHGVVFTADGWAWAGARIAAAMAAADCVVVDELGRLESRGLGHLARLALPPRRVVLLVAVRVEHAAEIATRLGSFSVTLSLPAAADEVEAFTAAIAATLRAR